MFLNQWRKRKVCGGIAVGNYKVRQEFNNNFFIHSLKKYFLLNNQKVQ